MSIICKMLLPVAWLLAQSVITFAQVVQLDQLNIDRIPSGQTSHYMLTLVDNPIGPLSVPVIAVKGINPGPVLGITAAIHGDELNGIAVIQEVSRRLDPTKMNGVVLLFPVLNPEGFHLNQRDDRKGSDLNRIFPGSSKGDISQQHVAAIKEKILPILDYMVDMHTASFGHINTYYVRADMANDTLRKMAELQMADILLDNAGIPSAGTAASAKTMRAEAILMGIPTITVEYADPQVIQPEMVRRGTEGILRLTDWLKIQRFDIPTDKSNAIICRKSYWIYTDMGGLLEVTVELGAKIQKNQEIARLSDIFGNLIKVYRAPESGIVIGKSSNPVAGSGGRIIHLGID